jgi:eukaryotic-like serine/threonine-protein kinase
MTPELWERLKSLFDDAMEKPAAERSRFVDEVCGDDRELKKELAALLTANDEQTGLGNTSVVNVRELFPADPRSFSAGELILDRFMIVRYVGGGGMGDVYEAMDLELGRIALKTIRPDIAANPDMLARFKKEVQLALKISGPHVCRIHSFYVLPPSNDGSKRAFLTMEFLDGITLADKISESGALSWQEAKAIALEICEGLRVIHEAGIIHRDLKSRNIMLASRNGSTCAVLMDFGLAHEVVSPTSETATDISMSGTIVGTPDYMAPEQFEGKEASPATDIYALGVVLYELVTGKHPFAAQTPIGAAILRGKRPCLASSLQRGLPRHCDEVICKCLEFDPKLRYQSAREVAEDLRRGLLSPARLRKTWFRALAMGVGALLLLSGLLLVPAVRERVEGIMFSSREKHVAVLPFEIAGNSPETEALGDGLMDSLAGKLSNLDAANQSLWVVPASEVRARKVRDATSAMREFGATIVVNGNFERDDRDAHLRLTLIDPKKMREIGYADVDNQAGDLAALEDEAVTRLARLMNVSAGENLASNGSHPVSRAAYEDYLTGLGYFQRFDKPGNIELAIQALQNSVKTDPHFALGFAQLAQVYFMKWRLGSNPGLLKQAEAYARQAAELDDRVPATDVALAQVHKASGKYDLAIQEFQRALMLDSRNAEALAGIADSYQNEARNSEAEAAYIKAAALRPDDWAGYSALGVFYDDIGQPRKAIAQYRRALELTPDNSGLYTNLGLAYMDLDDPKMLGQAEEALKKSIAINPTFVAYGNLGLLYLNEHQFNESIAASQKALQLNSQTYDVWCNLTAAYEWLRDDDKANAARKKAIDLLEGSIKLNPQNALAHATLASMLAKNGLREQSLERIRISLALSPKDQYVLSQVADAYELLAHRQNAIKYLSQALANGLTKEQLRGDPEIQGVLSDRHFRMPGK